MEKSFEFWWPLEAGKGKEMDSPLDLPRGMQPQQDNQPEIYLHTKTKFNSLQGRITKYRIQKDSAYNRQTGHIKYG